MYRGIIYVQSTEMEESSIYRLVIRESLNKHKEFYFDSLVYITYVKEMSNLYTHNTPTRNDSFGVVKSCGLRGQGRRD